MHCRYDFLAELGHHFLRPVFRWVAGVGYRPSYPVQLFGLYLRSLLTELPRQCRNRFWFRWRLGILNTARAPKRPCIQFIERDFDTIIYNSWSHKGNYAVWGKKCIVQFHLKYWGYLYAFALVALGCMYVCMCVCVYVCMYVIGIGVIVLEILCK